jgi:3-isopropylmalate dehydrogenase
MNKKITVIYGDGIGPEVTRQAVKVLETIAYEYKHEFTFTRALLGAEAIDKTGTALPSATVEMALESDAVIFGAVGDPKYDNDPNAKVRPEHGILGIRKALQLYANIRPINIYPSLNYLSPLKAKVLENVDFVIYRELTGGIYFGNKESNPEGTWSKDECTYSKEEIERITHLAFKAAEKRRKKLTLVDKANVLETSRLWRRTVQAMETQYPKVSVNYMFVDNAAMQIIINPAQFDVILTENLFGDILSDEASVLTGSLGLAPSASVGNTIGFFEPIHGSFPQAAGKDIANPLGSILSAAMMLEYFGLYEESEKIKLAVNWTLSNAFVTKDIDPVNFYFTNTIGDLICDYIQGKVPGAVNKSNIEMRKSTII